MLKTVLPHSVNFTFERHAGVGPEAVGAQVALKLVGRDCAAVHRFLPVEEGPTFIFVQGFEAAHPSGASSEVLAARLPHPIRSNISSPYMIAFSA